MMNIPAIATVADLQRKYRTLVKKIKSSGEPLLIVNRGKADVVVMDADAYGEKMEKLKNLEEEYLLKIAQDGLEEYKKGETVGLKEGETLLDLLSENDGN